MAKWFWQSLPGPAFLRAMTRGYPVAAFAVLVSLGVASPPAIGAGDPNRGNEVFQQYCAGCHGPQGRGGRKSGFMPRPKNLSMKGYTELLPDEYLFTVILKGGAGVNKSEYMPAFEGTIAKDNIENLIAFIRTLVLY
jgi:cytochrome c oxidase cbb3-type subunit III